MSSLYDANPIGSILSRDPRTLESTLSLVIIFIFIVVFSSVVIPLFDLQDKVDQRRQNERVAEEWLSRVTERAVEPHVREQIESKNRLK